MLLMYYIHTKVVNAWLSKATYYMPNDTECSSPLEILNYHVDPPLTCNSFLIRDLA